MGQHRDCIILASTSPRRKELVTLMGIPYKVFSPQVEETASGSPEQQAMAIARKKAEACAQEYPDYTVLAADTIVCVEGELLGKPCDEADAARMLRLLSGSTHQVYTGVCVIAAQQGICKEDYKMTSVTFSTLTDREIARYVKSGEPLDKAGGYALQGMGGMYVESICGSYSNVIGLPLTLVRSMLLSIPGFQLL